MFEVADDKAHARYIFHELVSVTKTGDDSWRAELEDGRLLNVRYKHGIVHMALAETEDELINENIVLKIKNIKTKVDNPYDFDINKIKALVVAGKEINFNKIKDYMGWAVDENNVWE